MITLALAACFATAPPASTLFVAAPSASTAVFVIRAPSSPVSHDVYDRKADLCFRISQSDEHREAGANKKENMPRHVMGSHHGQARASKARRFNFKAMSTTKKKWPNHCSIKYFLKRILCSNQAMKLETKYK